MNTRKDINEKGKIVKEWLGTHWWKKTVKESGPRQTLGLVCLRRDVEMKFSKNEEVILYKIDGDNQPETQNDCEGNLDPPFCYTNISPIIFLFLFDRKRLVAAVSSGSRD